MSTSTSNLNDFQRLMFGIISSAFVLTPTPTADSQSTPSPSLSFPPVEPCTGNCSQIHDPSIVKRSDGTWFRFSTNGNIAVASAPAISGPWEYLGAMLPQGSVVQTTVEDPEIWCPDVFELDGTFHAYYAVSGLGSQESRIGVATSTTLEPGSWEDQGEVQLPVSTDYNLIDPNIFREGPDAPIHFVWGSAWKGVYQTELNGDASTKEEGADVRHLVSNTTRTPAIVEGGFQFWWLMKDGKRWYYMFFSSGACCDEPPNLSPPGEEYKILVCRGSSPTGPFTDKDGRDCSTENGGSLVLGSHDNVYAPGGQGVIFDSETMKLPAVYYHYVNPDVGYRYEDFLMGWNYLDFGSGWPEVVKV